MIAVDTNVLIDLLGADETRVEAAEASVRNALVEGPVVVCEVVVSEVTAGLGFGADIMDVVEDMGVRFLPMERRSAIRAGEMQRRFNQRRKASGQVFAARTIPDFLVGAHALLQCDGLITRDGGFFRDYFKGLRVIEPRQA